MTSTQPTASGRPSRRQLVVIACLVALGVVAGALILRGGASSDPDEDGHGASHASHTSEKEDDDGHGHGHVDEDKDKDKDKDHGKTASHEPRGERRDAAGEAEGRIEMDEAQIQAAGIALEASRPATLRDTLQFPGEIRFNEDRTAHIVPRASGVVESVAAQLGQKVRRGQVLAVVSSAAVSEMRSELQASQQRRELARTTYEREKTLWEQKISPEQDVLQARQTLRETEIAVANATQKLRTLGASTGGASLGRLELRAPFDGIVIEKHIALGEAVREDTTAFTISDLSNVWAELDVPARDISRVRVGERVVVRAGASDATAEGTVSYVGALIGEHTRTARARVVLPNPRDAWRPGLFVTVEMVSGEAEAPVTVASEAIQTLEGRPVVFQRVEGGFVPRAVRLGRSDGGRVEITDGLAPGANHAAAGSFVVKAQQGKGAATHTH